MTFVSFICLEEAFCQCAMKIFAWCLENTGIPKLCAEKIGWFIIARITKPDKIAIDWHIVKHNWIYSVTALALHLCAVQRKANERRNRNTLQMLGRKRIKETRTNGRHLFLYLNTANAFVGLLNLFRFFLIGTLSHSSIHYQIRLSIVRSRINELLGTPTMAAL